jgi:peptide/nickel transport system ATP-binding protein
MGLACNSKLLICDEPTTALDVTIQAQILKLIKDLKTAFKNSVLFITHNLGVIFQLCDKVAVMYAGKIVEYGRVNDIFNHPTHPYTIGLLAAIPRVSDENRHKALEVIPGMVPNLIFDVPGCRFHPRCSHAMLKCQMESPALNPVGSVKCACFLHDSDKEKAQNPDIYKKMSTLGKSRYEM